MDFDLSDFLAEFLAEVNEHLGVIEQGLLDLETSPDAAGQSEIVASIFRSAHTIKGSARMMGYEGLATATHAFEDVLGAVREGKLNVNNSLTDSLLQSLDELKAISQRSPDSTIGVDETSAQLQALLQEAAADEGESTSTEPHAPEPISQQKATPQPGSDDPPEDKQSPSGDRQNPIQETVRLPVQRLDDLMRLTTELRLSEQEAQLRTQMILDLSERAQTLLKAFASNRPDHNRSELHPQVKALLNAMNEWRADQSAGSYRLNDSISRMEEEVISLRLLPINTILTGLPRMVRDLEREHNKQVQLIIEGEDTELDRRILQNLGEPLLHLIRNAVDHGIESPQARIDAGKPPGGTVRLKAFRQGKQVSLQLSDDGAGMSAQKLRDTVVRKKLLSAEEAAKLDDQSALDLIFMPGFSTSKFITTTSGRGVGMEIVKKSISQMGGSLEISTQPGTGTVFSIQLPLTLTLAHVILISIGGQKYAIPAASVEHIVSIRPETLQYGGGREFIYHEGESIPFYRIASVLGRANSQSHRDEPTGLILSTSESRSAIAIDAILAERDMVLKPLGPLLNRTEFASGATILPNGSVGLVLDPAACLRAARNQERRSALQPEGESVSLQKQRVLVVEDTYTTRELERSILEASGYEVETAKDGLEGWQKVQSGEYDLMLTDVEMPHMNGFELTAKVRSEDQLRNLPIIILTGMEQDSEKRRGLEVGAQAYLVKSRFDQSNLLETIDRLLA